MTSDEIETLRKEVLNISRDKFAQMLGVTSKTVYRWERDESSPQGIALQSLLKLKDITDDKKGREAILTALSSVGGAAAAGALIGVLAGGSFLSGIAGVAGVAITPVGAPLAIGGGVAFVLYKALKKIFEQDTQQE